MTNLVGTFSPDLQPEGWFDETLKPEGWFSQDLLASSSTGIDATISGATFTVTESLFSGSASGQVNANAPVATITQTYSLLAGSALGQSNATAGGTTLVQLYQFFPGSASGQADAIASGVVFLIEYSLAAGQAVGQAEIPVFLGGGFSLSHRARMASAPFRIVPLHLKGRLFTKEAERRIDIAIPEKRALAVAELTAQPFPNFRMICQPVFDKSVVLEKRKAQVFAIMAASRREDMRILANAVGWR